MTEKNKIETRLEVLGNELRSQESVVGDVMDRINRIPAAVGPVRGQRDAVIWRFMMNRYTRIAAAAAVLVIVAIVTFMTLEKATPSAYALDQTISAFQNIKFVHVTDWQVGKDEPMQTWMEYDNNAEPIRMRLSMPEWKNPLDGPKEAIVAGGIAQVYMPKKNVFVTVAEQRVVREMRELASGLDAGELFKKMAGLQASGKRNVDIVMPSAGQDKIIITSTGDGFVKKCYVDPSTKLLAVMETYAVDNSGKETLKFKMDCDYVRPETDVFTLKVPEKAMKVDLVNVVGGIPQGDMTDTQIATECVRQFWQACIDGDYQKAGGIYSGISAEVLKKGFGQTKVTKVLSIGEPTPNADRPGVYEVSNAVEFTTGQTVESKTFTVFVRKGDDPAHPDNWMITGGI